MTFLAKKKKKKTIDIEAEEPQGASAGRHGCAGAPLLGCPVQEYHGTGRERWRGGLRRLAMSPAHGSGMT